MNPDDHVMDAIRDFKHLLNSLEKKERSETGKSFRSRCRELPGLIDDVGVISALSFCYAKSSDKVYKDVKNALQRNGKISDEDHIEKGYGIFLYFVLNRLKDLKLIDEKDLDNPISALEKLITGKQRIASRLLRPYLVELKKLSEAVFEPER